MSNTKDPRPSNACHICGTLTTEHALHCSASGAPSEWRNDPHVIAEGCGQRPSEAPTDNLTRARIECRRAFDAVGMLTHLERANAFLGDPRPQEAPTPDTKALQSEVQGLKNALASQKYENAKLRAIEKAARAIGAEAAKVAGASYVNGRPYTHVSCDALNALSEAINDIGPDIDENGQPVPDVRRPVFRAQRSDKATCCVRPPNHEGACESDPGATVTACCGGPLGGACLPDCQFKGAHPLDYPRISAEDIAKAVEERCWSSCMSEEPYVLKREVLKVIRSFTEGRNQ